MPEDKEIKDAMHSEHIHLPKKDKSKTVWIVISIILLIGLIGLGAYGYMQINKLNQTIKDKDATIADLQNSKKKLEDATAAAVSAAVDAAKKSSNTSTDQDKILSAIRSQCAEKYTTTTTVGPDVQEYKIDTISGNYAKASYLCKGSNEGPSVVLVKQNNNWNVVASGIGDIVQPAVRQLYNIPDSFK